jgi:choline-sulfatase
MRKRPNILMIQTDQHRHDLMTCAGRALVPTPNMDRLADRGVRFTNAYCASPVCVASRMAMLTGLYPHSTDVVNNTDRLDWRYRTLAHHFAEYGYLTALIGKMHFNDAHAHGFASYLSINDWLAYLGPKQRLYADEIASHPLAPHFFSTMIDDGAGFPDVSGLWDGASPWVGHVTRSDFSTMASLIPEADQLDAFIARESVRMLESAGDQPFMLVASLMKPHTPLFAPADWTLRYPIDGMALPDIGEVASYPRHLQERIRSFGEQAERMRRAHRAGYLANLSYVDVCIGRILDGLERAGLAGDTIVVYTSDHGEMDGDHGMFQKFCMFEPAVRVPLIVCDPRRGGGGRTSDALVEQVGLYPTLAELAGIPAPVATTLMPCAGAPARLDGTSFAGLVGGDGAGPEAAFSEFNIHGQVQESMIRTVRYKYVHNRGSTHEFYDLVTDAGESRNLIDDGAMRGLVLEHHGRLMRWRDPASPDRRRLSQAV